MNAPNLKLKALIIEKFGKQTDGALAFKIREDRLSRIVHNRVKPAPEEKRVIAWRLQKKISEIFPTEDT